MCMNVLLVLQLHLCAFCKKRKTLKYVKTSNVPNVLEVEFFNNNTCQPTTTMGTKKKKTRKYLTTNILMEFFTKKINKYTTRK